jgi:diguanylate cyclase (GGDEF)-like protein
MSQLHLTSRAPVRGPLLAHLHGVVDGVLRFLSLYIVPMAIGVLSLLALLMWNNQYQASGDQTLAVKVVLASTPTTQAGLLAALEATPAVEEFEVGLRQGPVWFLFAPSRSGPAASVLELPSRHAVSLACWDAASMALLGAATRSHAQGLMAPVKSGFAMTFADTPARIMCRGTFAGPARLNVVQWAPDQMAQSVQQYHRRSGLLDGGMIVLTLFVLMTALINRQWMYVMFAGWLILNLRIGALSAGWDIQWLGQVVPEAWLLPSRSVTISLYALSTLTLYMALFGDALARTAYSGPLKVAQWLCLPLLACAFVLPYNSYLPVMWALAVFGLVLMTLGLITVMAQSRSRVAFWFAASFAVTFLATLAEVLAAAVGKREWIAMVNSVLAALASSLLAALAVAEQMRLETQARVDAQAKLEHAYEAMPVGLFTLDLEGRFLSANPALGKMLGTGAILPGQTCWKHFFTDQVWTRLREQVQQADAELQISNREASQEFLVCATLARGKIEGVLQDITQQNKANEQLRFMAHNDPLTKVFNRRGIERAFDEAFAEAFTEAFAAHTPGKVVALAYIDLDRFKLINDLFGHHAGDEVLLQVCERITAVLADGQHLGRVGGDEFVIVMPDTTMDAAELICRGIVGRIGGKPFRVADKAFHVRCSVGLIEVAAGLPMKDAMSTADHACREAKQGQNAGFVVYERHAKAFRERESELRLVARLSGTDPMASMFVEMQPIMSLKAPENSLNFEVLLRMQDTDGSICSAGPIIAAAEKSGRAGVIDRWVLATTLDWIARHEAQLGKTQFVCMNLSGASLNDEQFIQDTVEILARYKQVASFLCMEVTESVALRDLDNTRRFIEHVRTFGVKVALDDFGAGYTSFSYLKELPADVLKIDGSFVVNINAHPANVAIVEAIVNLAVNLGMKTIAEWAEDAATVRTLAELGVDYVQGWAVAPSMLPEQLLQAESAATFVRDDHLLQLVRLLGAAANVPELFPRVPASLQDWD